MRNGTGGAGGELPSAGGGARGTAWGRTAAAGASALAAFLALGTLAASGGIVSRAEKRPVRIVSLVPAITEMLFAMDAGPLVVGVSSFDQHPAEVAGRTRVGALLDPDVERIIRLRPDLVALYASQDDVKRQLARAGIATFDYTHGGLADIPATIRALGTRTGRPEQATRLAAGFEARIALVRRRTESVSRPRTLLVFGREPLALRNVYASGGVGFLHDMLDAAGAINVFAEIARENVQATTETILARAPEVIVELRYGTRLDAAGATRERATWSALAAVPAVRTGRVILLVGDEFVIPGPRAAAATERLARALHPERFRDIP